MCGKEVKVGADGVEAVETRGVRVGTCPGRVLDGDGVCGRKISQELEWWLVCSECSEESFCCCAEVGVHCQLKAGCVFL